MLIQFLVVDTMWMFRRDFCFIFTNLTAICILKTEAVCFFEHSATHVTSVLIRSNKMKHYAGMYLLQNYFTCFGCLSHPSSGVHQTVTAASGTGHTIRATTFCQRDLIGRKTKSGFCACAITFQTQSTPDDGCDRHPKHVE